MIYPQRCGRSLTEPLGRVKVFKYRGRPSVGGFGGVGDPRRTRVRVKILPARRARVLRFPSQERTHPASERRSSPLAGREFSGSQAKQHKRFRVPRSWPENLTISPASGEDLREVGERRGGGSRSWPESLRISPSSGEDSGSIVRREVGTEREQRHWS